MDWANRVTAFSAAAGAVVWLLLIRRGPVGIGGTGWIEALFLLAPLVVVPLGLGLIAPGRTSFMALRVARAVHPVAALAAVASFQWPRGLTAAGLAFVWFALTGLLALCGLWRFARGPRDAAEVAVDAALVFLPVGGGWLVLSRWGASPMGFEEPIVLLTAIHFHYAGFAALLMTGLAGRALRPGTAVVQSNYRAAVAAAMLGPWLVAIGITLSPPVELVGAAVITFGLAVVSVLTLFAIVPVVTPPLAQGLLALSSGSLLLGLGYAMAYAWGELTGIGIVSLATMARVHGAANAVGFATCGLLGWTLARRVTRAGVSCIEG